MLCLSHGRALLLDTTTANDCINSQSQDDPQIHSGRLQIRINNCHPTLDWCFLLKLANMLLLYSDDGLWVVGISRPDLGCESQRPPFGTIQHVINGMLTRVHAGMNMSKEIKGSCRNIWNYNFWQNKNGGFLGKNTKRNLNLQFMIVKT